ncbi:MAG: discoidin domain-containing protein [Candidatus Solibacter sp.]
MADILYGAAFTVAVCLALGSLLLQRLRLTLYRGEAALLGFVSGAGCLGFLMAILCTLHVARKGVFQWGGLAVVVLAIYQFRRLPRRRSLPAISFSWLVPFYLIFSAYLVYYFFNALAPEISPDGSGYHLGNVVRMWKAHGFDWHYPSMYAYLSQGTEMLFLCAFAFGRHSAAALVHFAWLCTLPLLIVCWGRRFHHPKAGIFAAILIFAAPVIGKDGISAYNDIATATLIYAVFYLLKVWDEEKSTNLLILIGILSGAAYATKYTAFLTLPFAALWVLRTPASRLRHLLLVALPALLLIAPWTLRNSFWLGNPFAPFFNSLFPNAFYHPGMERIYAETLKHYTGIQHNWQIPLELTLRGGLVSGIFGPTFLLAPLALLALRLKSGRQLLLAALVFAFPAYLNSGTRFLIPAAPFVALAIGIAFAEVPGALPALALFHAFVCWPAVLSTYCDPWNWRISEFPYRAALRKEPSYPFILKHIPEFGLKVPIELNVPPGERIFSFAGRPEAYIDREIIISYESTLGNLAQEILWTPQAHRPEHAQHFKFLAVTTRGVRVRNAAYGTEFWTVAEFRLRSQGREVPRTPGWRVSASPNGWESPLAFDNSYTTRWSAWENLAPRQRIQVELPEPQTLDEVVLDCAPAWNAHLQVEILLDSGRWVPITDTVETALADFPRGIRRSAARDLKALGLRYLLINQGDMVYEDMRKYPAYWGITELSEANGTHLFRLD